jgi:hypothetical protein
MLHVVDATGVIRYEDRDDRETAKAVDVCLGELAFRPQKK